MSTKLPKLIRKGIPLFTTGPWLLVTGLSLNGESYIASVLDRGKLADEPSYIIPKNKAYAPAILSVYICQKAYNEILKRWEQGTINEIRHDQCTTWNAVANKWRQLNTFAYRPNGLIVHFYTPQRSHMWCTVNTARYDMYHGDCVRISVKEVVYYEK